LDSQLEGSDGRPSRGLPAHTPLPDIDAPGGASGLGRRGSTDDHYADFVAKVGEELPGCLTPLLDAS